MPPQNIGVYLGYGSVGVAALPAWEAWACFTPSCVADFVSFDTKAAFMDSLNGILYARQGGPRLTLAVPPFAVGDSYASVLACDYDAIYDAIGAALVAAGKADTIIRPMIEPNVAASPWTAVGQVNNAVLAFQHMTTRFRATPGSSFTISWDTGLGAQGVMGNLLYPGDAAVDVVGGNIYDQTWGAPPGETPQQRWSRHFTQSWGIWPIISFANSRGKPWGASEFGVGTEPGTDPLPDGHGGGDGDGYFMSQMLYLMTKSTSAPTCHHGCLWDFTDSATPPAWNGRLSPIPPSTVSQFPLSAAAFLAATG